MYQVILGLLEELLKAHDGISSDRRLLRRGEDVPYLGKYGQPSTYDRTQA